MFSESAAAWVQAGGSILAILAAWIMATWQDRAHDRRKAQQIKDRIAATEVVLFQCCAALSRANNKMLGKGRKFSLGNVGQTEQEFDACLDYLSRVPIFDIPDTDLVGRVVDARYWVMTSRRRAAQVREQLEKNETAAVNFAEPLEKMTMLSRTA
ncbi:hypothetical protein [Brevundimonas sp. SL130]|uniref:hypothetical protein n=1 Tax=Brevundimonas sp. SL130 TaxID=2995143 RepID=UPI00226CCB7C|nr:hypothetical protein [Brevundimonas sp. SL130]WAC59264.1 hypothetical protein OU998_13720 [Brevundimonas sp. SL130]